MNKIEFKDLLKRYLTNDCNDKEKLLVEGWYDWLGDDSNLDLGDLDNLEEEIWDKVRNKTLETSRVGSWRGSRTPFPTSPLRTRRASFPASWLSSNIFRFNWQRQTCM